MNSFAPIDFPPVGLSRPDLDHAYVRTAQLFKAISHPIRLEILTLLQEDEMSVTGLLDQIEQPQPVISHH